jgi:high-affinity nickel-transport protein
MLPNPFDDQPSRIKTKTAITYAVLITANVAAWTWALIAFVDRPILLGTAFLAYMFGLRHAFDADHIAAIDNVVRKLMQDGKAPYSVGFFFFIGTLHNCHHRVHRHCGDGSDYAEQTRRVPQYR